LNGTFTIKRVERRQSAGEYRDRFGQSTAYFAYAGANPASLIQAALKTGYTPGAWNGRARRNGGDPIAAAAIGPANVFGAGYADSADALVVGQPANTVEIRYTLMGMQIWIGLLILLMQY